MEVKVLGNLETWIGCLLKKKGYIGFIVESEGSREDNHRGSDI